MNKLKTIILLSTIGFAATLLYIVYDGFSDDVIPSGFGIVLGNEVMPDGKPSARLKARLDKAVDLYHDKMIKIIIVSGGFGESGFDEAKVMKEYLIKQWIPASVVIEDNRGNNTKASAENAKQWIKGDDKIVIISQFFHLTRSRLLFKGAGFKNISTSHADYFELRDIYSTVREVLALCYYVVLN